MPLEIASFPPDLNPANPVSGDPVSQGYAHINLVKGVLAGTFPNITGQVTSTHTDLNNTILVAPPTAMSVPYYDANASGAVAPATLFGLSLLANSDLASWQTGLGIDGKVAKAGDTMTGALYGPAFQVVTSTGALTSIGISADGLYLSPTALISYDSVSNRIIFRLNGTVLCAIGTDGIHTPGDVTAGSLS